jgi:hypothetical protein
MAGGTDSLRLSERKLFQIVREHLPSLDPKTRNIIQCNENILYVWNSKDSCLLTLNVKTSKDNHADEPTHQVRKKEWKRNQYGICSPAYAQFPTLVLTCIASVKYIVVYCINILCKSSLG